MLGPAEHRRHGVVTAVAVALVAVTLAVIFLPWIRFAYRSPEGHVSLETAAGSIALLAAYLALTRFWFSAALDDLVLATGLAVLGLSTVCFGVVPALRSGEAATPWDWARVVGDMVGATLFAASAWLPPTAVARPPRAAWLALGGGAAVLGLAAIVMLVVPDLPAPIDPSLSPEASQRPRLVGNPAVEGTLLAVALAHTAAAVGFTRAAQRRQDELRLGLAVASAFAACSRLHYVLFPSLFSQWLHTGDLLRLCCYIVILAAVLREIAGYQPRLARAAVLEERRRIARDLHDGLTQELAFVAGGLRSAGRQPLPPDETVRLLEAADYALAEARQAVDALSADGDEPLGTAVTRVARALALRAGVPVQVHAAPDVAAPPRQHQALVGIAREAINNALRHSGARGLVVTLHDDDELCLRVTDDGAGLPALAAHDGDGGFGLSSMRERAEAVGGELTITSRPGGGTTVQARVPR